ncbi:hypothetical protein SKAU_G00252160 [Synaphobranchus kaupii]|uniref:Uncharacterized protein n=1 Tax=Synaphobranchus kaupii TaxID=118154 RepID=A0A9Q1F369_SYNKA|nr:hypothetical protein SKAU_G00252160 [Synaphobranchus kaupii]
MRWYGCTCVCSSPNQVTPDRAHVTSLLSSSSISPDPLVLREPEAWCRWAPEVHLSALVTHIDHPKDRASFSPVGTDALPSTRADMVFSTRTST